jgi:hypothetical protein
LSASSAKANVAAVTLKPDPEDVKVDHMKEHLPQLQTSRAGQPL